MLRNPEDLDTLTVGAINTEEMLSGKPSLLSSKAKSKSKPKAATSTQSAPAPRPAATRPAKPVVRIIREAKVTDQAAPKDSIAQ